MSRLRIVSNMELASNGNNSEFILRKFFKSQYSFLKKAVISKNDGNFMVGIIVNSVFAHHCTMHMYLQLQQ